MSRRNPPKKAISLRLPHKLGKFIDRTVSRDERFYNRSHLIEEALLAFERRYRDDPDSIELEDDASFVEEDEYEGGGG